MPTDPGQPRNPDRQRTDLAYGAGGLGGGAARADGNTPPPSEAPGVTPRGRRNSASSPSEPSEAVAGLPPPAGDLAAPVVASVEQRQGHYEPDEAQIVRARFTAKPQGPLPSQDLSSGTPPSRPDGEPVEDVAVSNEQASVWEAGPPRG